MKKQVLTKWGKAVHVAFPDTVVKWRKIKDFLGTELIEWKFSNGELSSGSENYFNKLFIKI